MASGPEIIVKIGADTAGAISGISRVNSALGSKMTGLEKFRAGVDRAFLPAVAALGALGVAAFDAAQKASDLAETQSKVGVIFGDASKSLDAWALAAPQALGQTQQAALDAASTMATFGKSAGLTGEDLVGFSTDLVNLSSDLASFHNAEPQEAVNALGAALRGESEPMRRFGVMLDDATLKAEAMALGIFDGTGSLTAQQKVLAAQAAIMKQTGDAQGDFARTADGAANQQRILKATLEQTQTELGTALLPVLQAVTGYLATFAGWARENQSVVKALAIGIGVLAGAVVLIKAGMVAWQAATAAAAAVQWALNAALAANPIGLVVIAIAALIAAVVLAYQNVEWFRDAVDAAWAGIQAAISAVVDWFMDTAWPIIRRVIDFMVAYYKALFTAVKYVWDGIWRAVEVVVSWFQNTAWPIIRRVVDFIVAYYRTLWEGVKLVWAGIQAAIRAVVDWFQNTVAPIIQTVVGVVRGHFDVLKRAVSTVWDAIRDAIRAVVAWIRDTAFPPLRRAIEVLGDAFQTFRGVVVGAWDAIRTAVYNAWVFITEKVRAIQSAIQNIPVVGGVFGGSTRSVLPLGVARGNVLATSGTATATAAATTAPVIVVNGALDPVATARQIRRILREDAQRMGQVRVAS